MNTYLYFSTRWNSYYAPIGTLQLSQLSTWDASQLTSIKFPELLV